MHQVAALIALVLTSCSWVAHGIHQRHGQRLYSSFELGTTEESRLVTTSAAATGIKAQHRARAALWGIRTKPIEELLAQFWELQLVCTEGKQEIPRPYVLLRTDTLIGDSIGGIGNRLPGVITGLFLALLLDRCLFIDYPLYSDYFTHELDFNWTRHQQHLAALGRDPNSQEHAPRILPSVKHSTGVETWLLQDLTEEFSKDYGLELSQEVDYSIALVQSNPHHQAFLKNHFPTGEVFASLAAFILHVAQPYERKILDFREKHFKQYNIGIQIRRRKCRTDSSYELELPCQEQPSVMEYCQVAKSMQMATGLSDNEVTLFLAADTREIYREVASIMGSERVIWTNNGIAPFSIDAPEIELDNDRDQSANPGTMEGAVIDLGLLSLCNDVLLTATSSFGYVAAAWGGVSPVHMLYGKHEHSQNPHFFRAINSEPCFWHAKKMMRTSSPESVAQFKSSPLYTTYSQCANDFPDDV